MSKSVQLPVCTPVFATYQNTSSAGMALAANPTANNQILNQCFSLSCTKRFLRDYSSPCINFVNATLHAFPALERYVVNMYFTFPYIHQIIKKMLDENFYIYYTLVDDFYLPEKSWFGIRHMMHDGTITGYDEADRTYTIVAFDINWVYRAIRIPQEAFEKGLESAIKDKKYGHLYPIRVKPEPVELNPRAILNGLKTYLNSDMSKYPLDAPGDVHGLAVHDYIALYLQKLYDGSISYEKLDWRVMRPFWEHKKCMLQRIEAVEQKLELGSELSEAYRPVVAETDRLRMLYALYSKKKKDSLALTISHGILAVKEQEQKILTELTEKMEGALNK